MDDEQLAKFEAFLSEQRAAGGLEAVNLVVADEAEAKSVAARLCYRGWNAAPNRGLTFKAETNEMELRELVTVELTDG